MSDRTLMFMILLVVLFIIFVLFFGVALSGYGNCCDLR